MPAAVDQADISGDPLPEPTRTAQEVAANARRTAGQTQVPPTPSPSAGPAPPQPKGSQSEGKGGDNPIGDAFSALGDAFSPLKGLPDAAQKGQQQSYQTGPLQSWEKNPFLPAHAVGGMFDTAWGHAAFDAQMVKSFGNFLNPDMISESAKNVWERQDAVGQIFRHLGMAATAPGWAPQLGLDQLGALTGRGTQGLARDVPDLKAGAAGQPGSKEEGAITGAAGQALSLTGNPLNVVMPEGKGAQLVAMLGLPLVQSLFTSGDGMAFFKQLADMDFRHPQTYLNLLWGASTAFMLRGHLPGAQQAVMRKLYPEWDQLAQTFKATRDAHNEAQRASVGHSPSVMEDWRQRLLSNRPVTGGAKLLVHGLGEGQKDRSAGMVGHELPSGAIQMKPSDEAQAHIDRQKAVLKRLGYKSVSDLGLEAGLHGLTGKAAQTVIDHWKDLGMTYDLTHFSEPDRPLQSPLDTLSRYDRADGGTLAKAVHVDNMERAYGAVMRQHLFSTNSVPRSMFRSLLGLARTKDVVHEMYWGGVHDLMDGRNLDGKAITKAMEGDLETYDKLDPVGKHVVDSARRLNALYQTLAKEAGYRDDFIGNFFWRRPQRQESLRGFVGRKATGHTPVASEKFSHRATAITTDPETGQLRATPAYKTVAETNAAIKEQRDYYAARLADPAVSGDALDHVLSQMGEGADEPLPWETTEGRKHTPLPTSMQTDPEVQAIRQAALTDPEAALKQAQAWVKDRFPEMDTDFFKVAPAAMRRQTGALHTHMAVDQLSKSLATFTDPAGKTRLHYAAVRFNPMDPRANQALMNAGYKTVDLGRRYDGWAFHPEFADSITAAMQKGSSLRQKAAYRFVMNLERKAIKSIMFIPMAHGLNVAGRFGQYWMMHPLDTTRWLLAGHDRPFSLPLGKAGTGLHNLEDPNAEKDALAYRMEAWLSGMVTPDKSSNWGYEFSKTHAGAIGDGDFIDSAATQDQSELPQDVKRSPNALASAGGKATNLYNGGQQKFWSWVNDFGAMVYHLDKQRLVTHGFPEEAARIYAMKRANTWMGHVAPEDWNPVTHDILRGLMFAPNWWRTLVEMYVPKYGKMGIDWTPQMVRHVVGQEMKTAAAGIAFQKMSGNALNLLTSGHLQNQNQPGAQDKIELTEPWTDHLPWTHGVPSTDPKTGARRTLENPLTRQQIDLERMLGYESGRPGGPSTKVGPLQINAPADWSAVLGGTALTAAGRLAPVVEAGLNTLGGIDTYSSLRDGQLRHSDPSMQGGRFGPTALGTMLGMLQMLPGGSEAAYNIQQGNKEYAQGKSWGTVTSDTIQRMLGTEPQQILSGWLTGVNPAYSYANKSAGIAPSDANYAQAASLKRDEQQWLGDATTAVMTGGTLPGTNQPATLQNWLREYHTRQTAYTNQMQAFYGNDPHYLNGQDGMLAQWEGLYDQARFDPNDPLSEINYAKLDQLQAQFKSDHSSEQNQLLQQGLAQHEQQNPMVRLYHDTLRAYNEVQQVWAQNRGADSTRLRQEISEYGQLYGQTKESQKYLHTHPDLQAWESWKKNTFYKAPLGMLYGLWYGSSSVLGKVTDLPAFQQQVVGQEEQQLFAMEPELQGADSGG